MKFSALSFPALLSVLLFAAGLTLSTIAPSPANPDPIVSQNSVQWIPLARVNPAKAVTLELRNKTPESLEYLITTHTNFRTLDPGKTTSLLVSDFPTFLNINAKRAIGVKYELTIEANKIIVDLKLTGGQGDTTLNVDDKGAIYLY
jgi:hypothetical protein